jgi:hypothetical protein
MHGVVFFHVHAVLLSYNPGLLYALGFAGNPHVVQDAATAGGAAPDAAPDATAGAAATGTAPPQMHGNQVDERTLPTAELPAPPGMALELAYSTGGGACPAAAAAGTAAALTTEEVQHLLSVYQFLWDHRCVIS